MMIILVVHYISVNPVVLHAELLNILAEHFLNRQALTKLPAAGSHPSPAPAHTSFLHAPSTVRGTSGSSPEERTYKQTIALKSSAKYMQHKGEQASWVSTYSYEWQNFVCAGGSNSGSQHCAWAIPFVFPILGSYEIKKEGH